MFRSLLSTYREAFSGLDRAVWLLALTTLVNRSGTMVLPFLVLYLTQRQGFATTDAGKALAIYGVGGVLGSYLSGWLCDRVPPRRVMVGSLALAGLGFLVLGQLDARPAILATLFLLAMVGEGFAGQRSGHGRGQPAGAAHPGLRAQPSGRRG
jgi:predicted MFS family arabinose efflux permease